MNCVSRSLCLTELKSESTEDMLFYQVLATETGTWEHRQSKAFSSVKEFKGDSSVNPAQMPTGCGSDTMEVAQRSTMAWPPRDQRGCSDEGLELSTGRRTNDTWGMDGDGAGRQAGPRPGALFSESGQHPESYEEPQ